MKKLVIVAVVVVAGLAGVAYYTGMFRSEPAAAAGAEGAAGGFRGAGGRQPLTVNVGTVNRAFMNEEVTLVGNLIGEATVAVAPRAAGRLQEVYVRLGDRVTRGQRIARIEDFELQEQIKQQ